MKRTGGTLIDVDVANWKITSRRQGSNWCRRARYKEVMAVGAVNGRGEKAEQSAEGGEMEVVAPGENIASYGAFECLNTFSGTSMAAPQVTALAAMLWQRDLEKPAEFIRSLIDVTANTWGMKRYTGTD